MKKLRQERKMYLNRSRTMYLRNIKLAKKINTLKEMLNDDTITYHVDEVGLKQSKITSFLLKNLFLYLKIVRTDYNLNKLILRN